MLPIRSAHMGFARPARREGRKALRCRSGHLPRALSGRDSHRGRFNHRCLSPWSVFFVDVAHPKSRTGRCVDNQGRYIIKKTDCFGVQGGCPDGRRTERHYIHDLEGNSLYQHHRYHVIVNQTSILLVEAFARLRIFLVTFFVSTVKLIRSLTSRVSTCVEIASSSS